MQRRTVERLTRELSLRGMPMTSHAVYEWIAGRSAPRPACAAAITQISRGSISFDDIYRHRTEMQAVETVARRARVGQPETSP